MRRHKHVIWFGHNEECGSDGSQLRAPGCLRQMVGWTSGSQETRVEVFSGDSAVREMRRGRQADSHSPTLLLYGWGMPTRPSPAGMGLCGLN